MHKLIGTTAVALAIPLGGIALAVPASANDADVIRTGNCSATSDWKLKLSPQNGAIETEFEVDSNVNGQVWTWTVSLNGTRVANGTATTVAPSGSFEVRNVVPNAAGNDTVTARATNAATGETCRARATATF